MSITTVDDNLIHYEALGRGDPLIFLHGWLGSWRYWWGSMQALSTHYRTFALDLWGFGDSSKASDRYSFAGYVEMLDAFIDRLGIAQPVILVGHSLGAAVALRFAMEKSDRVTRLVAVSLPLGPEYMSVVLPEDGDEDILDRLYSHANSYPEVESELRKTDPLAVGRLASEFAGHHFAPELDDPPCPVLLVYGGQDTIVQQPSGDFYHFQKPGKNRAFVSLTSSNHFPMLEETARFHRLVLDFARSDQDLARLSPKEYWQRRTH